MSYLSTLKKKSQETLDNITKELDKLNKSEYTEDGRFWQPTVDKAMNGSALIRFLPSVEGEEFPFVQLWSHGFQGPTGQWYIENCLSTLKKDDPVNEYNNVLWNSTTDKDSPERKQVTAQKRKLHYISNILVIKDPGNPENDGKVFLFKYGKKIFDKINDAMHPDDLDKETKPAYNPFDLWEGANFKLRIRKFEGYRNYDKSEFETPSAISDDDAELESIVKQLNPLLEFIAPDKFKTYDELKARLAKVLGADATGPVTKSAEDALPEAKAPKIKETAAKVEKVSEPESEEVDDFFASLNED